MTNCFGIDWCQTTQVNYFCVDTNLGQSLRGTKTFQDHVGKSSKRYITAFPKDSRTRKRFRRITIFDLSRYIVEPTVFKNDDGSIVLNGRDKHSLCVTCCRRHHHLQTRNMSEPSLQGLR